MAYGNWGAFIWKNGENITKECADTTFIWNGIEFIKDTEEDIDEENTIEASGHAVIPFKDFCIQFYKIYNPKIVYSSGKIKEINVVDDFFKKYQNNKLNLMIWAYPLDCNNSVYVFEIKHKDDFYFVICGNRVGNGYNENHFSHYLLKNVKFNEEIGNYWIEYNDVDADIIINKLIRLDDIDSEKYDLRRYRKTFWKNIFIFNFKEAIWNIGCIQECKKTIKWLK